MEQKLGSVRGDLIKWARQSQDLTMRWVRDHGGPCLGYQSEVENAKKAEVRFEVLAGWIGALNVTEAFVRGHIPSYLENPEACRGLAADVGELIRSGRAGRRSWESLTPMDRVREVLALIRRHSDRKLPRVVLAYVLGLEPDSLDATLTGGQPIVQKLMEAIAVMTTLPDSFFRQGRLESEPLAPSGYLAVMDEARQYGLTPDELREMIRRYRKDESA